MASLIKKECKPMCGHRVWRQQAAETRRIAGVFSAERRIWTVSSSNR